MMPSLIYEKLASDTQLQNLGINADRIKESQSWDERPNDGYFLSISFDELILSGVSAISRGPRTMTIAVHHPWDLDRDYVTLTSILNRIDELLLPTQDERGNDSLRVTGIRRQGRSGNLTDEGWKTITRNGTYGVLYDEYAA